MKADRRQAQQIRIDNIQARQSSYEVQQFVELLQLLLEDAKESLVACTSEDFHRVQGEAQTYDKILRMLNRLPIKTLTNKE